MTDEILEGQHSNCLSNESHAKITIQFAISILEDLRHSSTMSVGLIYKKALEKEFDFKINLLKSLIV